MLNLLCEIVIVCYLTIFVETAKKYGLIAGATATVGGYLLLKIYRCLIEKEYI